MKKIVLAVALATVSATPALAAPATASGSAEALVIAPIAITHDLGASLDFGAFATGTGGSVTVNSAGTGIAGGNVSLITGTTAADAFTVTGDAGRTFSISTGPGSLTGSSMTFTTSPSAATGTLTGGTAGFTVGGILTVPGAETAGTYTGSYTATVDYN